MDESPSAEGVQPANRNSTAEIAVVGSFVVGLTVRLPRMPAPGETLVGDLFDLGPGGKGTNLAIAAARQGKRVLIVARIGTDVFGEMALDLYRREGIDHTHVVRTSAEPTAVGLVYLQPNGENTIGLYRGANWLLSSADVEAATLALAGARLLATQLEIPDDAVRAAVETGRRLGLIVQLNPAPARPLPADILASVDVLTPNVGEARLLLGLQPDDETVGLDEIGQRLLDRGPQCVIITMGSHGCLLFQRGEAPVTLPALPVNAVDTVGAGDAFNGGLAVALTEGKPLVEAARWATVTAALSTTGLGAIPPLPARAAVEERLRSWSPS